MQGRIIKALAGYYEVINDKGLFLTRARGLFRHKNITPAVGDLVLFDASLTHMEGTIHEIMPRDNLLFRPRISNVTAALIVFSLSEPIPDYLLLDKLICNVLVKGIEPILVFNKSDLKSDEQLTAQTIYSLTPHEKHVVSAQTGEGIERLRLSLREGIYVVAGPSGTGKSSLLNALGVGEELVVGEISTKLRRGKHTTRHTQLVYLEENTYIADTPGFTNLDLDEEIDPLLLRECYVEFLPFQNSCRYDNCLHDPEPQCAVKQALKDGKIRIERYEQYRLLLHQLKER